MGDTHTKQQVRQFYDRVGWQEVSDGMYQNASYEDLRPVSRGYIHRCHMRVNRFLPSGGDFLLDAGSGPIQYPEYLTYSEGYRYRVCVDISIVALQEARKRVGAHGLFVVADVANLPFADGVFDGIVSLHTLHHLTLEDHKKGYDEFERSLKTGGYGVVVNGWGDSPLMKSASRIIAVMEKLRKTRISSASTAQPQTAEKQEPAASEKSPTGTFVKKMNAASLRSLLPGKHVEIYCWRSVSVRFLRAVIHPGLLGGVWLRLLFWLEDRFPRFFGEKGQYPLIVVRKP
jgi:SAM-dependent methyltransferase